MRFLLRADASFVQGTGHVMRLLSLAEELIVRGHEVHFATNYSEVEWLEAQIVHSGVELHRVRQHSLDSALISAVLPDWLVTDSYVLSAQSISAINLEIPVLAVIDGDDRGIDASLYLDHNFGAEEIEWSPKVNSRLLAGARYALVRNAVLDVKRDEPWVLTSSKPRVIVFMGGSDPTNAVSFVTDSISEIADEMQITIVSASKPQSAFWNSSKMTHVKPTKDLPKLLGAADIAISAAGTSTWELCTLGIPSLMIAVVDNQRESLARIVAQGLVLGIDLAEASAQDARLYVKEAVHRLSFDVELRKSLSTTATNMYDGFGKNRVVDAMEAYNSNLLNETR